jgi:hypothetical protein
MRLNVLALKRVPRPVTEHVFREAGQPEPLILHFRRPDQAEVALAAHELNLLLARYVVGEVIEGVGQAGPFALDVGGEMVPTTEPFWQGIISVWCCQAPESECGMVPYTPKELAILSLTYERSWPRVRAATDGLFADLPERALDMPEAPTAA